MKVENNTLNEKPIDQGDGLEAIWDIDEPSFDEAFGTSDNPDPIIGALEDQASTQKDVEDNSEQNKEDILLDLDETKEEEDTSNSNQSDDEGVDALINSDDESSLKEKESDGSKDTEGVEMDDNEFLTFAKVLAEKELLDISEDEEIEPTLEGLMGAFGKTINNRVNEEIELFQKGLPMEGRELLKHLMDGGNVGDFKEAYNTPEYGKVDISGNKESNQKWMIAEYMRLRGDSQEEIMETLEDYADLGKLEKQASKAQVRLEQYNKKQREDMIERRKVESNNKEDKRKEVLTNIETTINDSADIKGFPLSRKAKKELLSYMTENAVKIDGPNGPQYVTQFQADEMKASQNVDDFVLKAYLRMTNYNLDGVKKKSKSDLTSKLRKQLQNKKGMTGTQATFGGNKKPGGGSRGNSGWDI